MRRIVVLVAALLLLGVVNWTIAAREALLADGRTILLELAPVDPRSLMQGDYMALRFRLAGEAFGSGLGAHPADGHLVVHVETDGIARFRRFDDGSPLAPDEARLRYRWRDGHPKFATNAFFFEEGRGSDYAGADYGEVRVSPDGDMILVGLRGAARQPLGRRQL